MLYICLVCLSSFHVFYRIYLYMKLCIRNNSVQVCQCLFHHLQQVSAIGCLPLSRFSVWPEAGMRVSYSPLHRILRYEAVVGTISRKLVSLLLLYSNLVFCLLVGFRAQRSNLNFVEFAITQNGFFFQKSFCRSCYQIESLIKQDDHYNIERLFLRREFSSHSAQAPWRLKHSQLWLTCLWLMAIMEYPAHFLPLKSELCVYDCTI